MNFAPCKPMRRVLWAILLAAVALATPACSNKNDQAPTAPSTATNVAGMWAGNVTVLDTATRMTWTLSQSGASVTGPVLLALGNGTVLMNGFLTGSITGT